MDPIAIAGTLGAAGLVMLAVSSAVRSRRHRAARQRALAWIAEAVGLADATPAGNGLSGMHGKLVVRIETSVLVRVRPVGRVVIDGIESGLSMQSEGLLARVERARGEPSVESGDEAFDRAVFVRGAPFTVRALLDAETRVRLRDVLCARPLGRDATISVAGGAVAAELAGEWFEDTPRLAEGVRDLLVLAHRLEAPDDGVERLAQVAATDPLARVRLLAVETLAEAAPRHPATARALRRACDDRDPGIRLRVAPLAGGKESRRVLHALARATDVPDAVSAAAIEALGKRYGREHLRAIVAHAPAGRPLTDEAAVNALARGGPQEGAVIAAALDRFDDSVAATAAEVLGVIGALKAEDALLRAASRRDPAVRLAVAHALGAIGTVRAVPVLHELEADGGDVLRAAREAVVAIQSRLSGASEGQVSLAGADAGQLTVAESDGRVSLDPSRRRTGD